MIVNIMQQVKALMEGDNTGHGFDHVERVYKLALRLCDTEQADRDIVAMAALLHDCDDYKLFGQEVADSLSNSRKIMNDNGIDEKAQAKVYEIIGNMGYSKSLKGVRPSTIEGKIVSDADMLEAIGAMGTIRCLGYALAKCNEYKSPIFDENIFPDLNLTAEEYKKPNRKSDNFINHFFEKLLKIKSMMFTDAGKKEAELRHKIMLDFLYAFFREQGLDNWIEYLQDYEKSYTLKAI